MEFLADKDLCLYLENMIQFHNMSDEYLENRILQAKISNQ